MLTRISTNIQSHDIIKCMENDAFYQTTKELLVHQKVCILANNGHFVPSGYGLLPTSTALAPSNSGPPSAWVLLFRRLHCLSTRSCNPFAASACKKRQCPRGVLKWLVFSCLSPSCPAFISDSFRNCRYSALSKRFLPMF